MATSATYGVAKYGDSLYGRVFVTSVAGAYTLTGGAASFTYNHVVQAAAGSYAITGIDAALLESHVLSSSAGAYSITGGTASLLYNKFVQGDAGAYALTGYSSTLIHDDVVYAGAFAFHYTGNDAALTTAHVLTADTGVYALAGGSAGLLKASVVTGATGDYSITGKDADLQTHPVPSQWGSTGGVSKKVKTKVKKSQRDEVEAIVREEFDKMDGTYVPPAVVAEIQHDIEREIKQIDLTEHDYAIGQINALLLQARMTLQQYEAELDDEESLLMLI